jgi:hypothetical protein
MKTGIAEMNCQFLDGSAEEWCPELDLHLLKVKGESIYFVFVSVWCGMATHIRQDSFNLKYLRS